MLFRSWGLRRRYRELAVAQAVRATAQRMRSRADHVDGSVPLVAEGLRASIADDLRLADALQVARDHAYAARPSPHARRLAAVVLAAADLRDLLLASRLDLSLLGDDAPARAWCAEIAATLREQAVRLDGLADALSARVAPPAAEASDALRQRLSRVSVPKGDPRLVLVQSLAGRLGHVAEDVETMRRAIAEADAVVPLSPEQLARFVSPEGWPLAALQAQLNLQSGVLRHALRASLATGVAWALALALPWTSHPHWLVLSVAVVLRGSLEQTLSRRNDRLLGTVLGCLLAAGLAGLHRPGLLAPVFVLAVGTAHAFALHRYVVTATAATLMALLQPVLVDPASPPAVWERLADTAIGALLAWGACFMWPSWERHTLRRLQGQLFATLARHSEQVLQWQPDGAEQVGQRLGRQQAYAVLGALNASTQRNAAEPTQVQVPPEPLDQLLLHAWRVMALLGTVNQTLRRRTAHLDAAALQAALADTRASLAQALGPLTGPVPDPASLAVNHWPAEVDQVNLTPWVLRRLRALQHEAALLAQAARRLDPELR